MSRATGFQPLEEGQTLAEISDRKKIEQALRNSEDRFRVLMHSLDDVIWIAESGMGLYVSPAVVKIYGRSPEEFCTCPKLWLKVVDPRDRAIAEKSESQLQEQGHADAEYRIRVPDGQTKWVHDRKTLILDGDGVPKGMCGIVTDITARRDMEESLRASNRILAEIHNLQSKFIADAPAKVVFDMLLSSLLAISESDYGFIGEVLRAESGKPYLKTHAITDIAWNEETRRLYDENATDGLEFCNMRTLFGSVITTGRAVIANMPAEDPRSGGIPAGHPPIDAFLGIPLYSGGELVGMAGVANREGGYGQKLIDELTPLCSVCASLVMAYRSERERQQQQGRLREQEQILAHVTRLSTLGEMVAGIAHEINQPLAAISNFAAACNKVANRRDVPTGRISDWTRQISEQALRCGDIIRRLREFVKRNDKDRSDVNLNEVTRESLAMIQHVLRSRAVSVVCKLDESLPTVHADRVQIEQVIVNLLRNACEAMCHQTDNRTIVLSSHALTDCVRLTVADHGPGIQEQDRDRLFDAFYTTKPDGMGMGLAISRSIVEAHSGRLRIDNERGDGAAFHMELPLLREASETDSQAV